MSQSLCRCQPHSANRCRLGCCCSRISVRKGASKQAATRAASYCGQRWGWLRLRSVVVGKPARLCLRPVHGCLLSTCSWSRGAGEREAGVTRSTERTAVGSTVQNAPLCSVELLLHALSSGKSTLTEGGAGCQLLQLPQSSVGHSAERRWCSHIRDYNLFIWHGYCQTKSEAELALCSAREVIHWFFFYDFFIFWLLG